MYTACASRPAWPGSLVTQHRFSSLGLMVMLETEYLIGRATVSVRTLMRRHVARTMMRRRVPVPLVRKKQTGGCCVVGTGTALILPSAIGLPAPPCTLADRHVDRHWSWSRWSCEHMVPVDLTILIQAVFGEDLVALGLHHRPPDELAREPYV